MTLAVSKQDLVPREEIRQKRQTVAYPSPPHPITPFLRVFLTLAQSLCFGAFLLQGNSLLGDSGNDPGNRGNVENLE